MTSSEEFKQAIRAGDISEAFLVAMSNAPQLNITTKIITAEGELAQGEQADAVSSQLDNYLHTHINLIEGKVENEIGERLTGERYAEIKQFHLRQVTEGHQTIQQNLISLQKMFQLMSAFQQQQPSGRASWVDIAADVARESLTGELDVNQLSGGQETTALEAGTITDAPQQRIADQESEQDMNHLEPQLPSFEDEEDEAVVNDLLSLVDIDDAQLDDDLPEATADDQEDWGEWLDQEPEVKTEVFDLKSLNIRDANTNWRNLESQKDTTDEQSSET